MINKTLNLQKTKLKLIKINFQKIYIRIFIFSHNYISKKFFLNVKH